MDMLKTNLEKLALTPQAIRVLGVLIEKEKTTPDSYPLTLNSLILGCNQSTNRQPVVMYDEMIVERALSELRDNGLALRGVYAGSRVPKHRHDIDESTNLSPGAISVLAVLMLRGSQTLGEIKQRTERMHKFESLDDCDKAIDELSSYKPTLAVRQSRVPGQKESRVNHDVGGKDSMELPDTTKEQTRPSLQLIDGEKSESNRASNTIDMFDQEPELEDRVELLEKEVTVLTHEIMSLRVEIDSLQDPSA